MKKRIIIIAAAVLLAMYGMPRGIVTVGINKVYKPDSAGNTESVSELEQELELEFEQELDTESQPEQELESESPLESEQELPLESESGLSGMLPSESEYDLTHNNKIIDTQEEQPEAIATDAETGAIKDIESAAEEVSDAQELEPQQYAAVYTVLSANEAVVKNYDELESALKNDNGITTVYFGDNITMQGGIKISPKKANVVIVGLNPLTPERKQPYTLTDIDSASFYDTIYVDEAGTRTLHIRDLTMIGKNYYGPFSVADIGGLSGFVITYERVSYSGPQLCHNRRGSVRFIDSTASILGGNGVLSPRQEFSEAKHLVFEGDNKIDTATSLYSIFWHPLGGSFTLFDDASLVITSPNTSVTYGVFYADGLAYDLDVIVGSRAVLDMTISGVVAPELNVTINSFEVHEGGEFSLRTTKTADATVLRVGGALTVDKDAAFTMHGAGGPAYYLLRQQGGDITVEKDATFQIIADSAYSSPLNLAGSGFICNDPASVLFYNAGRDIVASTSAGRVQANAQQINYWNKLVPSGLDYPPLYGWRKADESNFMIDGTLAIGASANFSKISSNYAEGDLPGFAPDASRLNMPLSRVLAFGRLELAAAEPSMKSVSVSGVTAPGALVRASFTQNGVDYTPADVTADINGGFRIPTGVALDASTVITIKSSWQYLTAETGVTVQGTGSLGLYAPDVLEFYTMPVSPFRETVKRLNPDWKIVVSDTRGADGKWSVYAKLEQEMRPFLPNRPVLEGALVFVDDSGKTSILNTDADVLIIKHTPSPGEETLPIVWDSNKGILLDIRPGTAFADTLYTAVICWTIVDGV